jgi:cytochrome c-type biogenesis protein CcmF
MKTKESDIQYLTDILGAGMLMLTAILTLVTMAGYFGWYKNPKDTSAKWIGRLGYTGAAFSFIAASLYLVSLVYNRKYQYSYVWQHTANDLEFWWYRMAATWSGQEGSFALWGFCAAIIGFLVMFKAGKYETHVMPIYVTILGLLAGILIKQSPFLMMPPPTAQELAANPGWVYPPPDGMGLNPSLQNYWMTIHPPTIFFGFASLMVPFVYAIAAICKRDYDDWVPRVMPYSLLSCATLGAGLFMGGYWAYETQGWHGFWAWDPVENASFFPWLAITGLVHGLVVQKNRGGMVRTNLFLAILGFSLFLVGTFLTRSGVLAQDNLSVHAFANLPSSALFFLFVMLGVYFLGGILLWLVRLRTMPVRPTMGDHPLSRDMAMFVVVMLMIIACVLVTFGTTTPLFLIWMHKSPWQPKPGFYNTVMLPITLILALGMGVVPWLAWRKTNPNTFLRKLMAPWLIMLAFGFFMVFWVQSAQSGLEAVYDPTDLGMTETMRAWKDSRTIQRLVVVSLSALGFLAALSNSLLAFRVFRAKPLSAGGWLSHVGIGVMIIGISVSNTYERTQRVVIMEGAAPKDIFGYKIAFEKMTGTPVPGRPVNPDYDLKNAVQLRVTPPNVEKMEATDGAKTFVVEPRWFVHNKHSAASEDKLERMRWPHIAKYGGHDLYVGLANDPVYVYPSEKKDEEGITFQFKEKKRLGNLVIGYYDQYGEPGKLMGAHFVMATEEQKVISAYPALQMMRGMDSKGQPTMSMIPKNIEIPELKDKDGQPGIIYLDRIDPATKATTVRVSLPGMRGKWAIPLEITFKPWINVVWVGIIIAVLGVLLSMVRRIREARSIKDTVLAPAPQFEEWDTPDADIPATTVPATSATFTVPPQKTAKKA